MSNLRRFLAAHAGSFAAIALLALAGGGVALADAGTPTKAGPARATTSSRHARTEASKRARLVARKVRQGHRRKAHAAGAGLTYPDQGVQVDPPSSQAAAIAAASPLSTPAAVLASFNQYPAAQSAFGSVLTSGNPSASLATVTEQNPIAPGVAVGIPYQAWVVSVRGPVNFYGGPNSTPPPADTQCNDVGIYDLQLSQWTELLQSC